MKELKVAFLGAGEISDRFIIMAKKLKGLHLCAVYSRQRRNAELKAEKFGIQRYYDDYKMMLRVEKPDCVVITTPHSFHAKHAID